MCSITIRRIAQLVTFIALALTAAILLPGAARSERTEKCLVAAIGASASATAPPTPTPAGLGACAGIAPGVLASAVATAVARQLSVRTSGIDGAPFTLASLAAAHECIRRGADREWSARRDV